MITIDIVGVPIPWKRPGERRICGRTIRYDQQKLEKEQARFQIKALYQEPILTMPLHIDFFFYKPIPKNASRKVREQMLHDYIKPMCKPDLDNYEKFYLDCLSGYVYADDAQVVDKYGKKLYSLTPRVVIRIIPYEKNVTKVEPNPESLDEVMDDQYF